VLSLAGQRFRAVELLTTNERRANVALVVSAPNVLVSPGLGCGPATVVADIQNLER
jgi:hypothetical protein